MPQFVDSESLVEGLLTSVAAAGTQFQRSVISIEGTPMKVKGLNEPETFIYQWLKTRSKRWFDHDRTLTLEEFLDLAGNIRSELVRCPNPPYRCGTDTWMFQHKLEVTTKVYGVLEDRLALKHLTNGDYQRFKTATQEELGEARGQGQAARSLYARCKRLGYQGVSMDKTLTIARLGATAPSSILTVGGRSVFEEGVDEGATEGMSEGLVPHDSLRPVCYPALPQETATVHLVPDNQVPPAH